MTDSRAHLDAHLTEEERQGLADGSLPPDQRAEPEAHVAECAECAGDVARLQTLMARLTQLPDTSHAELDALWPAIRSRIERGKVVPLGANSTARRSRSRARLAAIVAGVAAAVVLAFALGRERRPQVGDPVTPGIRTTPIVSIADSSAVYQQEVESLLEELELRRSMMRPATTANVERDLKIIDGAIDELTDALARDPNNPALRQLLAASYRQKRDLLKQVDNAS
jgi:cytochrome c-type biogenesis protein CcmH/NrfG